MTEQYILEGNRLIAEFEGMKYYNDDTESYPLGYFVHDEDGTFTFDSLSYIHDWNWLLPVVEKIEAMGYDVSITKARCEIKDNVNMQDGYYGFERLNTKIEAVHTAVIEFIKHYNQAK